MKDIRYTKVKDRIVLGGIYTRKNGDEHEPEKVACANFNKLACGNAFISIIYAKHGNVSERKRADFVT